MILTQMILAQMILTQIEPIFGYWTRTRTDLNSGYHPPEIGSENHWLLGGAQPKPGSTRIVHPATISLPPN